MSDHPLSIGIALPTMAPAGQVLDCAQIVATAEWAEAVGFDAV